jgi:mevalonate kinase
MMPAISSSAPGKMILCGEHAVVYQRPAIAIPVLQYSTKTTITARPLAPKWEIYIHAEAVNIAGVLTDFPKSDPIRSTIEMVEEFFSLTSLPACEIFITSTLPVAAGMGSSASLSISLIRALSEFIGHPLEVEQVNKLAFEAEKFHHGNPSGVDNTVIAYQRPVYFIRDNTPEFLHVKAPFHFILADTGVPASTSQAVAGVRKRWQKDTAGYEKLFSQIGQITEQVRDCLLNGNVCACGELLTQNHLFLQKIGVSCRELDLLVTAALSAGALGAKLSGGGLGGNMLVLANPERLNIINEALLSAGAKSTLSITLPASVEE